MDFKAVIFDLDGTLLDTLEDLADSMNCVLERNRLPQHELAAYRYFVGDGIDMLVRYIEEYRADGFLINSVKSCNSFSAGQLHMLREVEGRVGKPGGFIESDLVDPRYFSAANVKNRLESYFQMIDQKRRAA